MLHDALERIELLELQVRHLSGAAKTPIPCPACGKAKFRQHKRTRRKDATGKLVGYDVAFRCADCLHEETDYLPLR